MPTVARFEGVKIQFYPDEHPPPHFHAVFAEYRAQIRIQPLGLVKGNFPPARLAVVLSWAEMRTQALLDTWSVVLAKRKPEKIQ